MAPLPACLPSGAYALACGSCTMTTVMLSQPTPRASFGSLARHASSSAWDTCKRPSTGHMDMGTQIRHHRHPRSAGHKPSDEPGHITRYAHAWVGSAPASAQHCNARLAACTVPMPGAPQAALLSV